MNSLQVPLVNLLATLQMLVLAMTDRVFLCNCTATEEHAWLWLGIDTSTPEECMHEVLKRDASSGVMANYQQGSPTRDWQGCQHRLFLWRPLLYDYEMPFGNVNSACCLSPDLIENDGSIVVNGMCP